MMRVAVILLLTLASWVIATNPAAARVIPDDQLPQEPPRPWHGLPLPEIDLHKEHWARYYGLADLAPRDMWDPDSSGYDALHVTMRAEPIIEEEGIIGSVLWRLRLEDPPPPVIAFDFFSNMIVEQVRVDGVAADFTHDDDRLAVSLPQPPFPGQEVTVAIAYHGIPELGFIWGFDVRYHGEDEVPIVYTSCQPNASRTWWPCKDRPDDKFTADLAFIVPDTMIAVSNGILTQTRPYGEGRTLYLWRHDYPITTYLVSLTATNFVLFEDEYESIQGDRMPLTYYAYPEDLEIAQEHWAFTPLAIRVFEELFGPYPFLNEKYGMAEYPWSGAMEHQTLSSMGEYFFRLPERSDWVVVHELAHQWWGNWVTCGTWRDIWLNEGFATYCEALWAESLGGADSLHAVMAKKKADQFFGPVYEPNFIFNGTVYRKGAWVLHMLRHVLGDDDFFAAIRAYGARHAYDNAVTADLQRVFEEFYGASLDWFFEPWVYGEGRPTYSARWDPLATSASGETWTQITVWQETSGPEYFTMPIDAVFYLNNGDRFEFVLWDSLPEQQFMVHTPAPPDSLHLDPQRWILAEIEFIADASSVAGTPGRHFSRLALSPPAPNPFRDRAVIPVHWNASAPPEDPRALALEVIDVSGRTLRELHLGGVDPGGVDPGGGRFEWDGRDRHGPRAPAGIYWVRLRAPGLEPTRISDLHSRRILKLP